jgi:hypothetical protein
MSAGRRLAAFAPSEAVYEFVERDANPIMQAGRR